MSCWVVPTIAAELWAVPLQQILDGLRDGHIPSKVEAGFTFVDVAPESPKLETPRAMRPPTPPTFSIVSEEEMAALTGAEVGEMQMEEDGSIDLGDWRKARSSATLTRRRPMAA